MELRPGSGGRGPGGVTGCRHVRSLPDAGWTRYAIAGAAGGAASPTRRRRGEFQDTLHLITLTTTTRLKGNPRHTRGRNGLESLVALHPCHHTIRGRRAGWAGTREGPEPDPAHHSPRIIPFMDGGPAEVHPGLQGPRSRLSHAQSKGHPTLAHQGRRTREIPPGINVASALVRPITVLATHEARNWAAGRQASPGHSSCQGAGPAMPGPTHHLRDGGPAQLARPGHGTSQTHSDTWSLGR